MFKKVMLAGILALVLGSCGNQSKDSKVSATDTLVHQVETEKEKGAIALSEDEYVQFVDDFKDDKWQYLSDKPCLIDFYATWCGPCQRLAPVVEALAQKYEGKIYVYKVDVDEAPKLSDALKVRSIPMLMFVPVEGQPEVITGFLPQGELETKLEALLK